MSPFSRQMFEHVLAFCYYASRNDMEPDIRQKLREFADKPYTDRELYDYLDSVSKIMCERIYGEDGKKPVLCIGYISGFVQATCDVTRYYERPEEGGRAFPLPQETKERWKRGG